MAAKKIWERIEDYMSAAAFAEAGESETARSILSRRRTVLLVVTPKGADVRAADYARNVCRRIEAAMEILLLPGNEKQQGFLDEYVRDLAADGIESRVVRASGCIKKKILEHTAKRRDIQFVVIESPEELDIHCDEEPSRGRKSFFSRLRCPLVVVSEAGSGA